MSKYSKAAGTIGRLGRLTLKELRETLRDRRTIVTLLLMPLIVYPLLSLAFQKFLLSNVRPNRDQASYRIGVEKEEDVERVFATLNRGEQIISSVADAVERQENGDAKTDKPEPNAPGKDRPANGPRVDIIVFDDLERAVRELEVDLGIRIEKVTPPNEELRIGPAIECELLFVDGVLKSHDALGMVEDRLNAINRARVWRLVEDTGTADAYRFNQFGREAVSGGGTAASYSLSTLVPLILILMTITGAVYPAIDLTAGERERGTMEMLVAAPIPRMGLLLAKYAAVLTVALLTATVNLLSMTVTILAIGLGPLLFGDEGLSAAIVVQVFGLMILFAAFFSAVLLAVTSFARSFKEAQAYLIPLMLMSIAPGLLTMIPGLRLNGLLAVTPLVNIVLLARDLFEQRADLLTALVVVSSTALFALAAIAVAGRIFGTDAILYGSPGTWSDLMQRPKQPLRAATIGSALMLLALMFPAYFVLSNLLGRLAGEAIDTRLLLTSVITIGLFAGLPITAALLGRVRIQEGFSLLPAPWLAFVAAMLLGLSLWPFVYEMVLFASQLGIGSLSEEQSDRVNELIEQFKNVSPVVIVLCLAVVPAVFEEFFFRGYLFGALRGNTTPARAIVWSAVIFGLFHLLVTDQLAVERLLPSTLLGIVLAWVRWRSGSVFPGMILHACHNGLLVMMAYYKDDLLLLGIGVDEQTHLPLMWLAAGLAGSLVGFALLAFSTRRAAHLRIEPLVG